MADFIVKGKVSLDTGDFVGSARRASDSLNGLNSSVSNTSKSMKYLKRGAIAAGVALGGLAVAGVKAASDYQQSMIAFTKMMGSAEKATTFVKELQSFAAATPFELPQVQAGAKKLMAFGFEASQVLPMLTSIGNAASGLSLGSEGIDRLTLAIGQMQAKGKVSGGELRQLAEAGIPALQYLADALGKTQAEILDMSEKGAIPASVGVGILIKGMEEGSKNAMGFSGMMEAQSKTMSGLMSTLKDTVRNAFVDGFNKYVPAISGSFEKMIGKVGPMMEKFIAFMGYMVQQIGSILGGIAVIIKPIFENFLLPAFKVVGAAILIVIAGLAKFGEFLKKNAGAVELFVNILAVAALAVGAYLVQVKLVNAASLIFNKTMGLKAKVLKIVTKGQLMLNAAMRMNPIGLVVSAITLLIAGFITAWNNSDAFRKIMIQVGKAGVMAFGYLIKIVGVLIQGLIRVVTGPLRLLLKGLSLLGVDAAGNALKGINTMTDGIGTFFDNAGNKVQDFADKLDGLGNKRFKLPSFGTKKGKSKEPKAGPAISASEFDFNLEDALKDAGMGGDLEKGAKAVQKDMLNVVKEFQDFIDNKFTPGFMEGADQARDTILSGLDQAKKVFDEFSKGMKGAELKKVEDAYNALNDKIRAMIPQAMAVAAELEAVRVEVDKAKQALEQAIESRAEGAKMFADMLAEPFGEPSELNTALSSAEASVGTIIGMYDRIVDAVNKRYEGIDPSGKNALLDALKAQTQQLVDLARQRDAVAKDLAKAQDALADAISSRTSGASAIAEALKSSFGQSSELADALSEGRSTADSIISMYERLASAIEARYAGIDPSGKNALLSSLENQTKKLLELVKKRDAASKALAEAQKYLDSVLAKQSEMKSSVTGSLKSFGTALANLSSGNSASTIKVIKTATGMVITQMKEGSQGVQSVTDQLKTRLQSIKDFSKNIQTLLASGLNKEYIQQLLSAGPEAAGATAALLASTGQEQINEINNLYSAINAESEAFGTQMADTFYGNSVEMAQAMVDGAESEYDNIVAEMTRIKDGITAALSPLSILGTNLGTDLAQGLVDSTQKKYNEIMTLMKKINDDIAEKLKPLRSLGTNIGTDLAQGLYDSLKAREAALVALAKSIADQIAMYMMQAMASIGAMQASQAQAAATAAAASAAAAKAAADALAAKTVTTVVTGILGGSTTDSAASKVVVPSLLASGESGAIGAASIAAQIAAAQAAAAPSVSSGFVNDAQNAARLIAEAAAKAAATNSTVVEKGAVTVTIGSNVPVKDVEGIMTRSLLNALGHRAE